MQWFRNLSIKTKLISLASVLCLMLIVTGGMGFLGVHLSKQAISDIYSHHITAINDLNEVRNYQLQIQLELLSARLETDVFEIQNYNDRVDTLIFKTGGKLQAYGGRVVDSEEKRLFDEYGAARMKMGVEGIVPMKDLLIAERFGEAGEHFKSKVVPYYKASSDTLDNLINHHVSASGKSYDDISVLAATTEWTSVITTITGLLLSVALTLAVSLAITRNVSRLRSASHAVAKGDLTSRAAVCCNDELGEVGNDFDAMVTEFGSLIGKVNDSTGRVTAEAQLLSSAAHKVALGSEQQITQAAAAAVSAEQLDSAVRNVAERITQVVAATDQAGRQAAHGQRVVNDAVRGIQDVAHTVEESASIIASLGKRSDDIGRIVQVIKDIADQTNLLALNAAIEAARAGEQGRGFAVVADEVRKLAERTTNATSEISGMIQAIQSETGQTVQIMERGSQQVGNGVSLANQAGQALSEINGAVEQVVELIREINASSQAQASAADDIAKRVEEIAQAAKTNGTSVEQVVSATQELRALSQALEASVSRFQL